MRGRSPAPLSTGSLLLSLLVVVCLLLVAADLASPLTAHADASLSKMRLAASNEWLELYINDATAAVAVREVRTGHVWHTNPPDWDKEETIAKGDAKQALGAQVQLTYYKPGDVEIKIDSYKDSVLFEQHEVTEVPGGIRVTYLLGRELRRACDGAQLHQPLESRRDTEQPWQSVPHVGVQQQGSEKLHAGQDDAPSAR